MWLPLCALAAPPGAQQSDVLQPVDLGAAQCSAQTWEVRQYDDQPNSTLPSASMLASRTVASLPNFFTRHAAVRMGFSDAALSNYHGAVPVYLHVNKAGGTSIKQSLVHRRAGASHENEVRPAVSARAGSSNGALGLPDMLSELAPYALNRFLCCAALCH